MNQKSFFSKILPFLKKRYAPRGARISFSASGEDIVISNVLKKLGVNKPFYIDIGAHHPVFGNNTYLFYTMGGSGILVEPNTKLSVLAAKKRPRDRSLNVGVAAKDGEGEYYSFVRNTRNTFSRRQAESWEHESGERATEKKLPLVSLDTLISHYADQRAPDIVSIDAEGLDIEILDGFSWKVRPKIFCIENQHERIVPLMRQHGYELSAQIFQNAIFVDATL